MFILVVGGAASGKSEYAENLCMRMGESESKLYVATMEPYGKEAKERILRHREMRREKSFDTLEKYRKLKEGTDEAAGYKTILVECLATLLANELFTDEAYYDNIVEGIDALGAISTNLILITSKIFSDGRLYDEGTMAYMRALAMLNRHFADLADVVVEVVCGIPVVLKGEEAIYEYI